VPNTPTGPPELDVFVAVLVQNGYVRPEVDQRFVRINTDVTGPGGVKKTLAELASRISPTPAPYATLTSPTLGKQCAAVSSHASLPILEDLRTLAV
jgi:hypothetical protein